MTDSGFLSTSEVRNTTQAALLLAIVAKIRAGVPTLNGPSLCFISDVPWPSVSVSGNLFCTVCPGAGQFDIANIDGMGNQGVSEDSTLQVTVWSRIRTDQIERFQEGLTDPQRGLLPLKQKLLKALAGRNMTGDVDGSQMQLIEPLTPRQALTQTQKIDDFASFSLVFSMKFNWDLGDTSDIV